MDDRDAQLLDIFAPAPEPRRGGWLIWGAVAGAVAFAGLAVTAAAWNLAPPRGRGAVASERATPAPSPTAPPMPAAAPAPAAPDDRDGAPPAGRELAGVMAELPASWRAGVPLTLPEAEPWIMPDLPFLESPAPLMAPMPPAWESEPLSAPPASAAAPPTAAPNRARSATAQTPKARPAETTGNAARCRGAVAAAQLGQDLSRTDLAFMRAGCAE